MSGSQWHWNSFWKLSENEIAKGLVQFPPAIFIYLRRQLMAFIVARICSLVNAQVPIRREARVFN